MTSKLEQWKLKKNVSSREMQNIVRIQQKRKAEDDKETRFTVRGRSVEPDKIERWQKRQKKDGEVDPEASSRVLVEFKLGAPDYHSYLLCISGRYLGR